MAQTQRLPIIETKIHRYCEYKNHRRNSTPFLRKSIKQRRRKKITFTIYLSAFIPFTLKTNTTRSVRQRRAKLFIRLSRVPLLSYPLSLCEADMRPLQIDIKNGFVCALTSLTAYTDCTHTTHLNAEGCLGCGWSLPGKRRLGKQIRGKKIENENLTVNCIHNEYTVGCALLLSVLLLTLDKAKNVRRNASELSILQSKHDAAALIHYSLFINGSKIKKQKRRTRIKIAKPTQCFCVH